MMRQILKKIQSEKLGKKKITKMTLLATLCASGLAFMHSGLAQTPSSMTTTIGDKVAVPVCLDDHCGVLDEHGNVLLPFDNDYDSIVADDLKEKVFVHEGQTWKLISADGKTIIKDNAGEGDTLAPLTPGYFAFPRNGKFGVIDAQGNEVQAARFDDIYTAEESDGTPDFIIYEINGKRGILDVNGKQVTDAVYTTTDVTSDFHKHGMLILAKRDKQNWVIDLKTGQQKPAGYNHLGDISDGHMVADNLGAPEVGLVDANGNLVIGLKYSWLGAPGEGLIAFRKDVSDPCGYMDYHEKVVIPARYTDCLPFGKKSALVQERSSSGDTKGKYGSIDTSGSWLSKPVYDGADVAGLTELGYLDNIPGYASIAQSTDTDDLDSEDSRGLFDMDENQVLFKPTYAALGMLTNDLFEFADKNSPSITFTFMGESNNTPALGVMNRTGKHIIAPSKFIGFSLDNTKHFLKANSGIEFGSTIALYDLQGHLVMPARWQKIEIHPDRGFVLGYYATQDSDNNEIDDLAALYDFNGKPVFTVETSACGAQQILNGASKPVWPLNPEAYCEKK